MLRSFIYKTLLLVSGFLLISTLLFAQFDIDWPKLPGSWSELKESTGISGSINARMTFYTATKNNKRRPGFNFNVYGRPVVRINDLYIPVDFSLGTYQNKFRQSFNRLGISPTYKWITLYLGNNSVNYSPLALSGHRFLGIGLELNPGKFRFGFIWGRFNRKIDPDSAQITGGIIPTYTRKGFGLRLGFGKPDSYVDLIIFKAKDDSATLKDLNPALRTTPAENAVVALSVKQTIFKRLKFNFDIGFSAYTSDIASDEYTGGDFSFAKIPGIFLKDRTTTQYLMAVKSSLAYKFKDIGLNIFKNDLDITDILFKVSYDRIDPNYQSMGTYFFKNDIQRLQFATSFKSWSRKISINFPLGFEWNNILDTKKTDNKRVIAGLYINYIHSRNLVFNFAFSNYRTRLTQDISLTMDTLLVNQVNRQFSLRSVYRFMVNEKTRTLSGMLSFLSGRNINEITKTKTLSSINFSLAYQFGIKWQELKLNTALGINNYKLQNFTTTRIIPSAGATKSFFKNKMNAGYNLGMVITTIKNGNGNFGLRNNLNISMNIFKKQSLSFNFYYLQNMGKNNAFAELQGEVRYRIQL